MATIKVNFTDEDAKAEVRTFEPLPTGEYTVTIFKAEDKTVKTEFKENGDVNPNYGKPMWNLTYKVQGGPYDGRTIFHMVMLFPVAINNGPRAGTQSLDGLSMFLKAIGIPVVAGKEMTVPNSESLLGKKLIAVVQKKRDDWKMKQEGIPANQPVFKNEVKGVKPATAGSGTNANGASKGSILP